MQIGGKTKLKKPSQPEYVVQKAQNLGGVKMTKRQKSATAFRERLIATCSLELILMELVNRGLNPTVTCKDGVATGAK